jgi:hypothetical protein
VRPELKARSVLLIFPAAERIAATLATGLNDERQIMQ